MSDEQLIKQVQFMLQRELTPEERKFLTLANPVLKRKENSLHKTAKAGSKIA